MADDDEDSDRQDTPQLTKRPSEATPSALRRARVHGIEDRDLESERERRRRALRPRTNPLGVPEHESDEVTSPLSVIEYELNSDDYVAIERLRRNTRDPYEVTYKLARTLKVLKKQGEDSGTRDRDALAAAIASQERRVVDQAQIIAEQDRRTDELERKAKFATKIASAAIAAALAGIGGLMGKILDKAGDERETAIRLHYLEDKTKELADDLKQIRTHLEREDRQPRRYDSTDRPWLTPPAPTTPNQIKGNP